MDVLPAELTSCSSDLERPWPRRGASSRLQASLGWHFTGMDSYPLSRVLPVAGAVCRPWYDRHDNGHSRNQTLPNVSPATTNVSHATTAVNGASP